MMLQCAPNLRDIGGIRTADGGRIRTGRIFRAEAIGLLDQADVDELAQLGVRTVCDLRSERERTSARSHWLCTDARVLTMDVNTDVRGVGDPFKILKEQPDEAGARTLMKRIYEELPNACAPHLRSIFNHLSQDHLPLLVHCTAGKDRTGFIIAMVLYALGVSQADIMTEYLLSAKRRNPTVSQGTRALMEARLGAPVGDDVLAAVAGVRSEYLETSFRWIDENVGSIDQYLTQEADLSQRRRDEIVELLVEQD